MPEPVISIQHLSKIYANGFPALKDVSLEINRGEIFALLGPNGAGKTTLINIVCGLTRKTSGEVSCFGKDVEKDYRFTRSKIGLVPQEINSDFFFTVKEVVALQGGFFGFTHIDDRVEKILREVNLWDKRSSSGRQLSGGMKRRLMIAKALVHNPDICFLDEPTAGVDVELRANLWNLIRTLKSERKTIILTTHYLEEAQELADRIGIINDGKIVLVEDKTALLSRHGTDLKEIYLNVMAAHRENGQ